MCQTDRISVGGLVLPASGADGSGEGTIGGRDVDMHESERGEALQGGTTQGPDDWAWVRTALARVREGHPQVIVLRGPDGLGTAGLDQQLADEHDVSVVRLTCHPHQSPTPYIAFRELLRQVIDVPANADSTTAGDRLLEHVRAKAPSLEPWTPLLALPIGATVPSTERADRTAPAFRTLRLRQALTELLHTTLTDPTMIVIEQLQWLDASSRELLGDLLVGMADRPWCFVLAGTRVDGLAPADADVVELAFGLDEVGEDSLRTLARHALGDVAIHPRLLDRIIANAGGSPRFLLEMIAHVRDGGSGDQLPVTVEEAVSERLRQLDPVDHELLGKAAVAGFEADLDLLSDVIGALAGQPDRWLPLADFVEVAHGHLRFREPLHHRVAYGQVPAGDRLSLHARAAEALTQRADASLVDLAAIAGHFEAAGRPADAWRAHVAAGRGMRAQGAVDGTIHHLERALETARAAGDADDTDIAAISEQLGDARHDRSLHAAAAEAFRLARSLATADAGVTRLQGKLAATHLEAREYDLAERCLEDGLDHIARQVTDEAAVQRAELCVHYARLRFRQGAIDDTRWWTALAADHLRGLDGPADLLATRSFVDASAVMQVRPRAAREGLLEALDHYGRAGDLLGMAKCHNNLGVAAYHSGDWHETIEQYRQARDLFAEIGHVPGAALTALNIGEMHAYRHRHDEAATWLEDARAGFRAVRDPLGAAIALSLLGWSRAQVGNPWDGEIMARDAMAILSGLGARDHASLAGVRLAHLLVMTGRSEEATQHLERAVASSPPPSTVVYAWRINGLALEALDDADGARTASALALRLAHEHDLPHEAALAAAQLASMGSGWSGMEASELAAWAEATLADLGVAAPAATG